MPRQTGIAWTQKQKEIAEFLRQGLSPQAVIEKGYGKSMVYDIQKELKKTAEKSADSAGKPSKKKAIPQTPRGDGGETHIRPRLVDSVQIGEILIEPADWRINQFGGLLILGTYEHARDKFGYDGTVGEFLCDCTQIIRKIFGMDMVSTDYLWKKEDFDDGTSEGENLLTEGGEESGGGGSEDGPEDRS